MVKKAIRKKVNEMLAEAGIVEHRLFYSSLLDQLYILYILILGGMFLLLAHFSIWPILLLLCYTIIAYLFGAYRNHSVALTATQVIFINGRSPFANLDKFEINKIESVFIGRNLHPILDRLFIIPSNVYISITLLDKSQSVFYTNIDFESEAKAHESTLEELAEELIAKGLTVTIEPEDDLY